MIDFERYGGIVRLSSALHRYFGLECEEEADERLSRWLDHNQFRCVIVVLLDALGTSVLNKAARPEGWFRTHMAFETTTVYPPTTSAATTSFLTSRYPVQNAWLGWNQYFAEKNDEIILFRERSQYGDDTYPGFVSRTIPVEWLMDKLNRKGIKADSVWPSFGSSHPSRSFDEFCENVYHAASDPECRFVYGYWDDPDGYMHEYGPSSPGLPDLIGMMEEQIAQLSERLPEDTGLMIIADHSQIDSEHYALDEDEELCECLLSAPSLEARTVSFRVKEECRERFRKLFSERFKNRFLLLTHEEVLEQRVFGKGNAHPRAEDFIGDYLAVALTPLELNYRRGKDEKGNHAGGMEEEALIPVILNLKL